VGVDFGLGDFNGRKLVAGQLTRGMGRPGCSQNKLPDGFFHKKFKNYK
jgi:hypothetical protein